MLFSFLPFFFLILPLPINAFRSDELDQSESAESDNTALSRTLSKMWRMDTKHRQKFEEQMEFLAAEEGEGPAGRTKLGPIGDRNPSVLSRPVISAYKNICVSERAEGTWEHWPIGRLMTGKGGTIEHCQIYPAKGKQQIGYPSPSSINTGSMGTHHKD